MLLSFVKYPSSSWCNRWYDLVLIPLWADADVRPVPWDDDDIVDNALGTRTSRTRSSSGARSSPGDGKHGIEPPRPDSVVRALTDSSKLSPLEDFWWQAGPACLPTGSTVGR